MGKENLNYGAISTRVKANSSTEVSDQTEENHDHNIDHTVSNSIRSNNRESDDSYTSDGHNHRCYCAIVLVRSVKGSIAKGQEVAEALAQGNLAVEVRASKDEIGVLVTNLGKAANDLRELIKKSMGITQNVNQAATDSAEAVSNVASSSEEIAASTEQVSAGFQEIAAAAEEISASGDELSISIKELEQMAIQGSKEAKEIEQRAQKLKTEAIAAQTKATGIYELLHN